MLFVQPQYQLLRREQRQVGSRAAVFHLHYPQHRHRTPLAHLHRVGGEVALWQNRLVLACGIGRHLDCPAGRVEAHRDATDHLFLQVTVVKPVAVQISK